MRHCSNIDKIIDWNTYAIIGRHFISKHLATQLRKKGKNEPLHVVEHKKIELRFVGTN